MAESVSGRSKYQEYQRKIASSARIMVLLIGSLIVGWVVLVRVSILRKTDQNAAPAASLTPASAPLNLEAKEGMVRIRGGRFTMGAFQEQENRAHDVFLDPFWIDDHEVTNAQFLQFVKETDYITTAEQLGRAEVFQPDQKRWDTVEGAYWRRPEGSDSTIVGRDEFPVVQISWFDAVAYARWAEKRLPTEAEWEFAARGGLHDSDYPWGRTSLLNGKYQANSWQGQFPYQDDGQDGYPGLAPVASFSSNRYGLYDLSGNVWEWCSDWYDEGYYRSSPENNPRGPSKGASRVIRGGSWLTMEEDVRGNTVWARNWLNPRRCDNQTGFRCVRSD